MSMLLAVSIGSIAVIAYQGYRSGRAAIRNSVEKQLISLREAKSSQIEAYFRTLRSEIEVLGNNPTTAAAMRDLSTSFGTILGDAKSVDGKRSEELRQFYKRDFAPRLEQNLGQAVNSDIYLPSSILARHLQYEYIIDNPNDVGKKDKLDDAGDGTDYSKFHKRYHPIFRKVVDEFGYYDLFLIDNNGNIVYSVFKEADFGTSLLIGPYARSSLAKAFKDAQQQNSGYVSTADFSSYDPSYGAPAAFMATPLYEGTNLIGVMAVQVPVDEINTVMTNAGNWEADGLGQSGETFLVADDFLMRSDSRALVQRPEEYVEALRNNPRVGEETIEQIERLSTSVLEQTADSDAVESALAGKTGIATVENYLGDTVISAYGPLDIQGLKWAIVSEIDRDEIFQPITRFTQQVMISAAGLVFLITLASLWLARKFLEPVNRLSEGFSRLAKGHKEVDVEVLAEDELGYLAKSFNHMVKKNRKTSELVFQKSQETESLLLNMFPASVAKRLKRGEQLISDEAESVTVAFLNVLGFQDLTEKVKPKKAIAILNEIVKALDDATDNHGIEKIKSTGSEYLAVSGLSVPRLDHSKRIIDFAVEGIRLIDQVNREFDTHLQMRAGVHTGGVMAGTVGSRRLIYDIWGDTVVKAHYVQSAAEPNSIFVSKTVANSLIDVYEFEPAGEAKGRQGSTIPIMRVKL